LQGCEGRGLCSGDRVLFLLPTSDAFLPAFWACVLGGMTPVPLPIPTQYEPGSSGVSQLFHAWRRLRPAAVLTSAAIAPVLRHLPGGGELRVLALEQLPAGARGPDHAPAADDPTLIMLTSGSTGMPKGVVLTHRNLVTHAFAGARLNDFRRDDVSYSWMPLDHVASLIYFHIRDVVLGCLQVHVPTEPVLKDPLLWLDQLERFRATITFAPNYAFGLVNDAVAAAPGRRWDLSSLRFVLNGGEAVVPSTARRFLRLLEPHGLGATTLVPAWGMSETSSGVTYCDRFSLATTRDDDTYAMVGRPIQSFAMRIVDESGRVVPEGTVGSLQVRGATVTSGYFDAEEENRESFTEDGWFVTGDLGFLRDGRLAIMGRQKDVIIINGVNYSGPAIESEVETVEGVERSFTAVCATRAPGDDTDGLAVFLTASVPEAEWPRLLRAVRKQVASAAGIAPSRIVPLPAEDIPKTAIGKIQRRQLKQRLEAGAYDHVLRRVDILLGGARTLPHWFYRRSWQPRQAIPAGTEGGAHRVLMWLDEAGLGEAIADALRSRGDGVVVVEPAPPGAGSGWLGPDRLCLDPADEAQWRALRAALRDEGRPCDRVVHCAGFGPPAGDQEEEAVRLSAGLLAWARAWGDDRRETSLQLTAVASHSQRVEASGGISPGRAVLQAWLRTLEREFPELRCRHIDLPADEEPREAVEQVLAELDSLDYAPEVAYRNGKRLAGVLSRVPLGAEQRRELPFIEGGLYLVSGGLGGVGAEVCRLLRDRFDARLLILGRTRLEDAAPDDERAERLRALGPSAAYECLDACDAEAAAAAVARAEQRFGRRLDGVLHLAATFHERPCVEETAEGVRALLAPRLRAGRVLCDALERAGGGLFVAFGSVNGYFGGSGVGAYSAASAALAAFCADRGRSGTVRTLCLDWTMWDEVGLSRGYAGKAMTRASGYEILSAEQGLQSLLVALGSSQQHVLIGLDAEHPQMLCQFHLSRFEPLLQIRAFWAGQGRPATVAAPRDRFGNEIPLTVEHVDAIPLADSGEVDRAALLRSSAASDETPRAPRNDLERLIASAWQEVLRIPAPGIHDDFLAMGGDSVRAARVMNRLQERLGEVMHVTAIFEAPTVAKLAEYLTRHYPDAAAPLAGTVGREVRAESRVDGAMLAQLQGMVQRRTPSIPRRRNPRALFIVAPPRSGTTLLRVMLGGHPRLFAPPELYLLGFGTLRERVAAYSDMDNYWTEGTTRALMELRGCDAPEAVRIVEELERAGGTTQDLYALLQEWLDGRLLVDKTPTYTFDPDTLEQAEREFEAPLYVHLVRHPLGTIRSFEEARIDQILPAHVPGLRRRPLPFGVRQLAELVWLMGHRNALRFLANVPPERRHVVRFEELVSAPRAAMQALCGFIGVEFEEAMLEPYRDRRGRMTEGVHDVSRMLGDIKFHQHSAIDAGVAERWRESLDGYPLGEPTLELARRFGYECPDPLSAAAPADEHRDPAAAARALLDRVDEMTPEEVEALLAERGASTW
jgi:acyl-CoA synthetase (AMP-forming)/AMP-acid ligase II/NAD(P)-dependent dehydrogenase (short-subunit alcohol dehydrogenase family)